MSAEVYMVHKNWAGGCFVKTLEFFEQQGGNKKSWGKAWHRVLANSIEDARRICKETIEPHKSETNSVPAHSEDAEKRAAEICAEMAREHLEAGAKIARETGVVTLQVSYHDGAVDALRDAERRIRAAELAVPAVQPKGEPVCIYSTEPERIGKTLGETFGGAGNTQSAEFNRGLEDGDLVRAIADAEYGLRTHQQWLDYLEHPDRDLNDGVVIEDVGSAEHQREWIARYNNILTCLCSRISSPPAPRITDEAAEICAEMARDAEEIASSLSDSHGQASTYTRYRGIYIRYRGMADALREAERRIREIAGGK